MRRILQLLGCVSLLTFLVPVHAQEDAAMREVVEKAIKAQGGLENLTKYKSSVSKEKGKVHVSGQVFDFTSETSIQLPDRLRVDVRFKVGDQEVGFLQVIDSNKGWFKLMGKTEELTKDMGAEAKEQMNAAYIGHLVCLKDKEFKLSPLGEAKVGNRPAVGVRVERKDYRDVNLYFDKDKSWLLKLETRSKDIIQGGQEFTSITLYDDFRKVEGMMVPYKGTIQRDGKPYVEGEVVEVKFSEKLDDSTFAKP